MAGCWPLSTMASTWSTPRFGGGRLVRFARDGLDREVAMPLPNPTDVAFAGPGLDRLFVTFVDGALMAVDGLGAVGRIEPRCSL
jgi:D-xylonolactonase